MIDTDSRGGHIDSERARACGRLRKSNSRSEPRAWKGMGFIARWQCYWPLGQIPLLTTPFVLVLVLIVAKATPTQGSDCEPPQSCCQLQRCWDLFEAAREALRVSDDLLPRRSHHPSAEEQRDNCITLRTLHSCINMTRNGGCLGDLNFHGAHKGVERQMKQSNCSHTGPVYVPSHNDAAQRPRQERPCTFRGRGVYRQCGLFGDPHLRTFNDEFHTCRVQGAWPLLNNNYLTVQVTNDPVGLHSATATSKLTVVIKQNDECGDDHFITYQAQTDNLPATFDDGRTHLGRERSVQIREILAGQHVEIYIRYIDTTLIVRQIGRYFTFAAKMPEEIVNQTPEPESLQLCVDGCPASERIDYREFLVQKQTEVREALQRHRTQMDIAMSRDVAEEKCRRANVVDFYFDSCVFDLLTTGDANFTLAASSAMQDLLRLNPQAARMHTNRTTLPVDNGASQHQCSAYRTTLLLIAFCAFLLYS